MTVTAKHRVTYDTGLLMEDAAEFGWNQADLARVTRLHKATVARFVSGEIQTPKTAKALANAVGRPVKRYLVRATRGHAA